MASPTWLLSVLIAQPSNSFPKKNNPDWTLQKQIKGKWQGVKDGREGLLFEPSSPKEGTASFFYDGHRFYVGNRYEKTRYRIEGKDRLRLPDRNTAYTFKIERDTLSLGMVGQKREKLYRRVKDRAKVKKLPSIVPTQEMMDNENAAVRTLMSLIVVQENYSAHKLGGFETYTTLANLEKTGLMKWPTMGVYEKNGYRFREVVSPTRSEWWVLAVPVEEKSGSRKFTAYADGFVRSAPRTVPDPRNVKGALKYGLSIED